MPAGIRLCGKGLEKRNRNKYWQVITMSDNSNFNNNYMEDVFWDGLFEMAENYEEQEESPIYENINFYETEHWTNKPNSIIGTVFIDEKSSTLEADILGNSLLTLRTISSAKRIVLFLELKFILLST